MSVQGRRAASDTPARYASATQHRLAWFRLFTVLAIGSIVITYTRVHDSLEEVRSRRAGRALVCDVRLAELQDEARAALEAARRAVARDICKAIDAADVVRCLVRARAYVDNPRNRGQHMYTTGPIDSCQVRIEADGPRAIRFTQVRAPGSPLRTFSIRVDRPQ